MKLRKQQTLTMEFANCEIRIVNDELVILEYDKDGNVIEESNLIEELANQEGFLDEIGFKVSIVRTFGK
jgi:hypothetical protein